MNNLRLITANAVKGHRNCFKRGKKKKGNGATVGIAIQPFWPHAWSITHINCFSDYKDARALIGWGHISGSYWAGNVALFWTPNPGNFGKLHSVNKRRACLDAEFTRPTSVPEPWTLNREIRDWFVCCSFSGNPRVHFDFNRVILTWDCLLRKPAVWAVSSFKYGIHPPAVVFS